MNIELINELKNKLNSIDELPLSLAEKIEAVFGESSQVFNMEMVYQVFSKEKQTTLRGRIYRDLMNKGIVVKIAKGVYSFKGANGAAGVILHGNARNLELLQNSSIHLIIADHPYPIANGRNRNFNKTYKESTFKYNKNDFNEKSRVLIKGGFLVEFLPELKEHNWEYIHEILQFAKQSGFNFYAKVPWYKAELREGKIVDGSAFVGRKAVLEEVYIFTKGKPRMLRKRLQGNKLRQESGAKSMLPAIFMEATKIPKKRKHMAEKPESLLKKIIESMSEKKEFVLDQFAGSFNTFFTALELERNAIAIELDTQFLPIGEKV